MPKNNQPWDVTSDAELERRVRGVTDYDEAHLATEDMTELIGLAKQDVALETGVTAFYEDRGIAVALLGTVCAKAKGHVENSPVVTKNLGAEDVTFRASDGSSLQLAQYEEMVAKGLRESDETQAGPQGLRLTNTYFSDSSSL